MNQRRRAKLRNTVSILKSVICRASRTADGIHPRGRESAAKSTLTLPARPGKYPDDSSFFDVAPCDPPVVKWNPTWSRTRSCSARRRTPSPAMIINSAMSRPLSSETWVSLINLCLEGLVFKESTFSG